MHAYRTHTCGQLRKADVGARVRLSGWIHRKRDHGGLLFFDLRDHYGITQCVIEPDAPIFAQLEPLRAESVVTFTGPVVARTDDTVNADLPTGAVELRIEDFELQSAAEDLPLPVFGEPDYPEDTRLRYRFLDLRRETLHRNIMRRAAIIADMRERMRGAGFTEFQTPILTASSPEGARDFLVPSRIHPGKFYALPQAPQQFKQLLMVAGFDRYFQIAPCFRDEDPRADRLPGEFYQLDLEMSFVTQDDVLGTMEPVLRAVFETFADGKAVTDVFPRIPYAEAIRKYGSDKPDLRNPIEMSDASETFRGSGFKVFAGMLERDRKAEVWAIPAPSGGNRAFCDRMNGWAQSAGQPGLGYIFFRAEGGALEGAGPIAKNIGPERTESLRVRLGLKEGDAVFFTAGDPAHMAAFAGQARTRIGTELGLVDESRFALAWVVDFPMYEWNETEKKIDFSHNPFSMPKGGLEGLAGPDPLALTAYQYDLVCNGYEIASGAIRNHRPDIMYEAFRIAGYDAATVDARFGGMINAFRLGAPPHGGMAAGIDRIVMLLCGAQNLREITTFPMNQQAFDLMMGAPSEVSAHQLRELHIRVVEPPATGAKAPPQG
ncbi:MAG: aspartate--tRNA ligase [Alphaproteobacteria bacterium]|nr:aspartate--tRNA ligase [Alphaproteobacteria bacterium]